MTRVLVLTRYDHIGASSRVRFLQYIPHLARMGLSFTVQPLLSNEHLRTLYCNGRRSTSELLGALGKRLGHVLRKSRVDVVWLQQEIFPFLPAGVETALLAGRPYVVDYDDAYHLYYQQHRSALVRNLFDGKIARLMRHADAVVVGNDTLGTYARAAGARQVHLVYSAVDTARFSAAARQLPETFRIGWIGTPMTAAQSLHIVREPLKQVLAESAAEAVFMGMAEDQFPDVPGRRLPWSEAAEESFLGEISVGLCPLDDSPWTRGKSGYKIIQYMSAGRPTLTSPVGIAADLVEPGRTGFHCATANDWYERLTALARDAALSERLGHAARERAVGHYDTAAAAAALHDILTASARG